MDAQEKTIGQTYSCQEFKARAPSPLEKFANRDAFDGLLINSLHQPSGLANGRIVSRSSARYAATTKIYPSTMQSLRMLPRAASSIRAFSTTTPRPLAKMQIIGRLADTPETSPTSTGQEITRFAVGVGSGPRDEDGRQSHVSWFRVASFLEDGGQRRLLQSLPKG